MTPTADRHADIVGIMLEVTDRLASQTILTQTEERFRLLFEQLPAIVYTVDRELRFTTGVGAALAPLGLRPNHTLTGISLYQYFQTTDSNHPQIAAHLRAIAGEAVDCEATWVGRTYALHVDPFRDRSGQIVGAIGVALDITDRVRLEAERDRLLMQERQARTLAEQAVHARDEFLAVAAHELFTPITALKSALQIMLHASDQGAPPSATMLTTAERQTRRLATLVADLLNVSRIQSGHLELALEKVDLVALVDDVAKDFADELERTRTVLQVNAARPVIGRWDRRRLLQVVSNLLSNAIKYAAGAPIEIAVEQQGSVARLRVRDHGIGIAADRLPRIFERFERAVSAQHYGGLGLGLFIVRSIVEAHHGHADAESELGRGTTITIELPLAGPP
jgi:PAS domain S-box-containing protein